MSSCWWNQTTHSLFPELAHAVPFVPLLLPFPARAWLYLATCYLLLKNGLKCLQGIPTPHSQAQEIISLQELPYRCMCIFLSAFYHFLLVLQLHVYFPCCFLSAMGKCLCFTPPVPPTIPCLQRRNKHFMNDICGFYWWVKTKRWLKECCELILRMYSHNTFSQALLWGVLQLSKYCAQVGGWGWGVNSSLVSLLDHCYL